MKAPAYTHIRPRIRAQLVAFVLLGLLAHALIFGAIHHHPSPASPDTGSASCWVGSGDARTDGGSGPADDSNCAACQMQRVFTSGLRSTSIVVEIVPQRLARDSGVLISYSCTATLYFSNRAPPLV